MKKLLAIFTCMSLLAVGACKLNSWNLAVGPDRSLTGISLDFNNGVDFVVPLFR